MNCGLCAEFCPFDAIKMNHDFEIAAYERMPELVFDLKELRVPTTYYARIRPTDWADEEAARASQRSGKSRQGKRESVRRARRSGELSGVQRCYTGRRAGASIARPICSLRAARDW